MHWICASRWAVAAAVGIAAAMAAIVAQAQGQPAREDAYFDLRRGLDNCRLAFLNNHAGRVGFIGGSITVATGWRDHTCAALQAAFPDTRFDFINAGIGGTNSTLGAFRLEDDVFRNGPVDLLFIEFAVNDGGDCPDNRRVRAMEGMVRRAHRLNPAIDIVIQYFVDQSKYGDLSKGRVPETITAHEQVAKHYDITVIDLAREVTRRLDAGAFDWDTFARDSCHPTAFGHEVYGECIRAVLDAAWAEPPAPGAQPAPRPLPEPLDPMNYENGRFIPLEKGRIIDGWQR
ncbi:MAG: SGNH/GDSL hydrolase family protein, partial [Candidatus Hydrogenedentes bacterium]|nr:SGNH/GDSL hydrolase family protein [Candidatus Hydrogenedentota bacterium]